MTDKVQADIHAFFTAYTLNYLRELHERTGSPMPVWDALLTARTTGTPPPEWVLHQLEDWARAIMGIETSDPEAVAEALGFATKGGKSEAQTYPAKNRTLEIAQTVATLHKHKGKTVNAAMDVTAQRFGVTKSSVKRAWDRHREALGFPRKQQKTTAELQAEFLSRRS